jgi:endonuclease YncB( thermonuclease family)
MYEYPCKIVRVVDGDTVDVDIDLGFSHWIHNERIRLYGVDTPECRTTDAEEKLPESWQRILSKTACTSEEPTGSKQKKKESSADTSGRST